METFTVIKEFIDNPRYAEQRERSLRGLGSAIIDEPLRELISGLASLPYCFTLQSCYGHFLYGSQRDQQNIEPLPRDRHSGAVEYRIAYLAMCLERSEEGLGLFQDLRAVTAIDPPYIQFGCAEWFWRKQVNSYTLQVEPERFKDRDRISVPFREALRIEQVRNAVFERIGEIVEGRRGG
jgi:hypothetical protein